MSLIYTTTNILCAATDVGMHGLLASQSCTILCYPLVYVHCGPVVDFFITKQTSLYPFDFVRNLFHLLVSTNPDPAVSVQFHNVLLQLLLMLACTDDIMAQQVRITTYGNLEMVN